MNSVALPHQPLSPLRVYTDFFGADARFGCERGSLRRIIATHVDLAGQSLLAAMAA